MIAVATSVAGCAAEADGDDILLAVNDVRADFHRTPPARPGAHWFGLDVTKEVRSLKLEDPAGCDLTVTPLDAYTVNLTGSASRGDPPTGSSERIAAATRTTK